MKPLAVLSMLGFLLQAADARELPQSEADRLEQRFFAAQRATETLQSAFTQTVTSPGLPAPVVSAGNLFYRSPDSLRIVYTRPAGDFLQLLGERFTSRRSGGDLVDRDSDHPSARALVALRDVLRGEPPDETMKRDVTSEGDFFRVTLTPQFPGPGAPEKIENLIEKSSLQLRSLSIVLPRGTIMRFDFAKIRKNRPVAENTFSLP
jgi:outer membrane lipoprotein-sorting protein